MRRSMRSALLAVMATLALLLWPLVAPHSVAAGHDGAIHPPVEALAWNR